MGPAVKAARVPQAGEVRVQFSRTGDSRSSRKVFKGWFLAELPGCDRVQVNIFATTPTLSQISSRADTNARERLLGLLMARVLELEVDPNYANGNVFLSVQPSGHNLNVYRHVSSTSKVQIAVLAEREGQLAFEPR